MKIKLLILAICLLGSYSCRSKIESGQEVVRNEIQQLKAQMEELEKSSQQINQEMAQIQNQVQQDQVRIQLSKSSLSVLEQLNQDKKRSWSDFFQNLTIIINLALLLAILWIAYWLRARTRQFFSAREAEAIFSKIGSGKEPEELKEAKEDEKPPPTE